ncbi:MAG: guanylate kinase [Halanaerobiales bacterium]
MKSGILFVLSGPSGVGKGTVLDELLKDFNDVEYSVSATTRPPREGEVDGEDYHFLTEDEFFNIKEKDGFLESARVHKHFYGTPKKYVDKSLKKGKDIILEIDIQGARQVKKKYPNAVFIFLVPPSFSELKDRLKKRNTENEESKKIRLENAKEEIAEIDQYDYQIVNDKVKNAVKEIKNIIKKEQTKRRG